MNTKINKTFLNSWAERIYSDNNSAITNLNDFKALVNSLPNAYESLSADAFITNISKDIDNTIDSHTAMENLQTFLEKVIENADNV